MNIRCNNCCIDNACTVPCSQFDEIDLETMTTFVNTTVRLLRMLRSNRGVIAIQTPQYQKMSIENIKEKDVGERIHTI